MPANTTLPQSSQSPPNPLPPIPSRFPPQRKMTKTWQQQTTPINSKPQKRRSNSYNPRSGTPSRNRRTKTSLEVSIRARTRLRVGGIDVVVVVVSVVVVVLVMAVVVVIMQFVPSRPEGWMTTVCDDAGIRRGRRCLFPVRRR